MKNTPSLILVIFLLFSTYSYSQENVTNEMKKTEIIGSFLYSPTSGNVYLISSDCENQKLLKLEFDDKNWKYDTRNLGGNSLQQKMSLAIIGKEKMKLVEKNEINTLSNLGYLMDKVFDYSNNPYLAISKNFTSDGIFYIDPRYNYTKLKADEFVPTFDGNVKVVSNEKFSIYFRSHFNDTVEEIFSADPNEFNLNNVKSIAFNQYDKNLAITVKKEGIYITRYYNSEFKKFFPESTETKYNFCRVGQILKGLKGVTSVSYISSLDPDKKIVFIQNIEVSELNKKGDFESSKKPQSTTDTLIKFPKDWVEYFYNGGKYQFSDTLTGLGSFDNYTFTGYYAESNNAFTLTSYPYDPRMQSVEFLSAKTDFKDLIEMCPNAPEVVREMEELNTKLEEIKRQGLIDNAKMKRFQFTIEETKDPDGMDVTNIKILKDCKLYDLNDSTNRNSLKELVNTVRTTRAKAIDELNETINKYTTLSKRVKSLCSTTQDIDTQGSKLLGALSKVADKSSKALLLSTLVSTTTKATELFNSYKAAKDQLDNAKKAIDNYKAVTQ